MVKCAIVIFQVFQFEFPILGNTLQSTKVTKTHNIIKLKTYLRIFNVFSLSRFFYPMQKIYTPTYFRLYVLLIDVIKPEPCSFSLMWVINQFRY